MITTIPHLMSLKKKKSDIMKPRKATYEEIKKAIGQKIKQERNRRGQSARTVAEKLQMDRVSFTHIENGRNNINAVKLWELACVFGCNPSDFLPPIPEGYALTTMDYEKIAKEDENAAKWAEEMFSGEFNI